MALNPGQYANARFYELLWPYRVDVLRMARMVCGNANDAEDLAQETLLNAFAAIDGLEQGASARVWLIRILRNTWMDRESRPTSTGETEADQAVESAQDWPEPAEMFEAISNQTLIEALQAVPEEMRWAILLVDVQSLDLQEAADVLDVPAEAIKIRARRGRATLRRILLPKARKLELGK
jgi:RNA polymerase sigma factor (sigma-70 family)